MAGKGKLKKFAELETFEHVFQKPDPKDFRGKWHEKIFQNEQPIVLELACGKGDYTIALAKRFSEKNFIGIDIKGNRIHVGAKKALEQELENVRFLRIFIDHIDLYFSKEEVDEIWITFPDPYLKKCNEDKRLISPKFLDLYKKFLKKNGVVQLKTDSPELFEFTKQIIEKQNLKIIELIENVYQEDHGNQLLTDIQTYYEKKHLANGKTIKYVQFQL